MLAWENPGDVRYQVLTRSNGGQETAPVQMRSICLWYLTPQVLTERYHILIGDLTNQVPDDAAQQISASTQPSRPLIRFFCNRFQGLRILKDG
jgi:hypothetical protein